MGLSASPALAAAAAPGKPEDTSNSTRLGVLLESSSGAGLPGSGKGVVNTDKLERVPSTVRGRCAVSVFGTPSFSSRQLVNTEQAHPTNVLVPLLS
jgi:hypothetical protein